MAYPSRPTLELLPQFRGTATVKQTRGQREALRAFVDEHYRAGRSLRELCELTGRSSGAVRRSLEEAGTPRRGPGAQRLTSKRR